VRGVDTPSAQWLSRSRALPATRRRHSASAAAARRSRPVQGAAGRSCRGLPWRRRRPALHSAASLRALARAPARAAPASCSPRPGAGGFILQRVRGEILVAEQRRLVGAQLDDLRHAAVLSSAPPSARAMEALYRRSRSSRSSAGSARLGGGVHQGDDPLASSLRVFAPAPPRRRGPPERRGRIPCPPPRRRHWSLQHGLLELRVSGRSAS